MRSRLQVPILLLLGCPDPSAPADGGAASSTAEGASPATTAAPAPPPKPPGDTSPAFAVTEGEGVKLSGSITYEGDRKGRFHIDFVESPQPGHFPKLVHSLLVETGGTWEIEVPKGFGKVGVLGYLDVAGDGPTDGDPAARIVGLVDIGTEPIANLDLVCSDKPDLGEFTPGLGAAPPPAADAPPVDPGAADPSTSTAVDPASNASAAPETGAATASSPAAPTP